ncbi:MAG: UpxY family transcription antiterminator [Prevotella sp.]
MESIGTHALQPGEGPSCGAPADHFPWYALRLYFVHQQQVADYLTERGMEVFVPMEYADSVDDAGKRHRTLRPVVRNLLFMKKTLSEKHVRGMVAEMPFRVSVLRKSAECADYYEIPARQMLEFRIMCNPDLALRQFISNDEAKLKAGDPVRVVRGPLQGLTGRLVRSCKKYFLLKEVPGIAVMLKVTRWCCEPV